MLWVIDHEGNAGKSFVANFLNILYGYLLVDGTMQVRDVALIFNNTHKGLCCDVPRSAIGKFNYEAVESFKNGYMSSGKYSGRTVRFNPVPVLVLANAHPDYAKLSFDRWVVLTMGAGALENVSKTAIINPRAEFPFVEPAESPLLTEDFDVRGFVCAHMPQYRAPRPAVRVKHVHFHVVN